MRIKENMESFNAFFGVFKIKGTGFKSLLILCRLNKVLGLYIPVLISSLKAGADAVFNAAAAVRTVS